MKAILIIFETIFATFTEDFDINELSITPPSRGSIGKILNIARIKFEKKKQ